VTHPLANLIAFYVVWVATALGAARGAPWLGPVAVAAWLTLHLRACGPHRGAELRLLATAGVMGYATDSILVLAGLIEFPPQARLGAPATVWMVGLWLAFAATLRHAFGWLRGRLALAAALGTVGGPLAYWAGARMGALTLASAAPLWLAVVWALATPALAWLAARVEAPAQPAAP
jgi:hypothetical protein